jgi:mannose-6-phosphate isomerase-like protein (cupin superfamily)
VPQRPRERTTDVNPDVQVNNSDVRVTRWTLAAGDGTGEHTHEYDYVVVPLAVGRMFMANADGSQATSELAPGLSYYRQARAWHNVRNDGVGVLDFVEVELVRPAVRTRPLITDMPLNLENLRMRLRLRGQLGWDLVGSGSDLDGP